MRSRRLWSAGATFSPAPEAGTGDLRRRWQAAVDAVRGFARELQ